MNIEKKFVEGQKGDHITQFDGRNQGFSYLFFHDDEPDPYL
jgi:hypothetical protein